MIAHWDIVQGSLDWHRIRYGKIGGTLCKGLFVDSDTLLDDIISSMLEPFECEEDSYVSSDMQRGNDLEPYARVKLGEYLGVEFKECGWFQCEQNQIIGISPDGITEDLSHACEIKCPSRKVHTATLRGKIIPLSHNFQVVHNFVVNPRLERLTFGSFRPECKHDLFVKTVTILDLINLGTKAKPIHKSIGEWAEIARKNADELLNNALIEIERLSF